MSSYKAHKPHGDGTHLRANDPNNGSVEIGADNTNSEEPRLRVESRNSDTYTILVQILKELKILNRYHALMTDVTI